MTSNPHRQRTNPPVRGQFRDVAARTGGLPRGLGLPLPAVRRASDCRAGRWVDARGLSTGLLAEAGDGRPPPYVPDDRLRAAQWRAAFTGAAGLGLDPVSGAKVPMRELIERLLARAEPGLAAAVT